MSAIVDKIIEAIQSRRVVTFVYNGKYRIVHPCKIGIIKGNRKEELEGYQVGGQSKSGNLPEFKNFETKYIIDLDITKDSFSVPLGYNKNDNKFDPLYASI